MAMVQGHFDLSPFKSGRADFFAVHKCASEASAVNGEKQSRHDLNTVVAGPERREAPYARTVYHLFKSGRAD